MRKNRIFSGSSNIKNLPIYVSRSRLATPPGSISIRRETGRFGRSGNFQDQPGWFHDVARTGDQAMQYTFKHLTIRTELKPGDIGYITWLHGSMYAAEYQYGIAFEAYVAKGFYEFYSQYDPKKDRVWVCEDNDRIVGFLLGMHRDDQTAQLRYFILLPACRGIGLGNRLMELFMEYMRENGYRSAYLWTTHELDAAAHLYKKFGFVLTEETPSNAFGKELREQRYDLHLV